MLIAVQRGPGTRLIANVLHNFVLAFPRHIISRVQHFHLGPAGIHCQLVTDEEFQVFVKALHELSTRRDTVGIKQPSSRQRFTQAPGTILRLQQEIPSRLRALL
jgi:hypothetical protein